VEDLTKELAETKDRLVTAQTIDLEVHTRENTQREQLQAKLIQGKQTIVNLRAKVDCMKIELEEFNRRHHLKPFKHLYILMIMKSSYEGWSRRVKSVRRL
jgi:hypothetical protein